MLYLDSRAINIAGLTFAKPIKIAHDSISGSRVNGTLCALIGGRRRVAMTRSQRRKLMNRRRRWFVDNIVMHHRRIHDRNRAIIVDVAKKRLLEKQKNKSRNPQKNKEKSWRERMDTKKRAKEIKGRIDARRLRARSRWISVFEEKKDE